ncbi:MAG: class I SAM-dependent RNA methyltransferase [Candidatus Pacearchaeota archaeon]
MTEIEEKKKQISDWVDFPEEKIGVFKGPKKNYRNRMDFSFHPEGLGLKERRKWWKVLDYKQSDLANEKINFLMEEIREFFVDKEDFRAFDFVKKEGEFMFAVIRATSLTSTVTIVLNQNAENLEKAKELVKEYSEKSSAENVLIGHVKKNSGASVTKKFEVLKGSEFLKEKILGREFHFHSQGFFQVNSEVAEKMTEHVRNLAEKHKNKLLLDIYGGVGVFGITCSEYFDKVVLNEVDKDSVELAEKNAEKNLIENLEAHALETKKLDRLDLIYSEEETTAIVDPPRAGINLRALRKILKVKPKSIIYVSCNPKRLSEELPEFKQEGFEIKSVKVFDIFPGTDHVETVVEMAR